VQVPGTTDIGATRTGAGVGEVVASMAAGMAMVADSATAGVSVADGAEVVSEADSTVGTHFVAVVASTAVADFTEAVAASMVEDTAVVIAKLV